MKTIFTIQHTQSEHHVNGMVGSWTDWPLTALGRTQAQRIAQRLRDELGEKRPVVYSSDLARAVQTAQPICRAFGVEPILRNELRERNLGRCCGKSVAWLRENLEMQERTVDDRLFSDAESRRDEWLRVRPFFDELMAGGEELAVVVSHGDLLSVLHAMFLGMEPEDLDHSEPFGLAGGVSLLQVKDDGRHVLRKLSDMSYVRK